MSRIYEFIHVHVVLLCDSTLPLNFSFSICSFINYNYIHGFISTSNYLFICRRCLLILCFCVIHLTLTAAKTVFMHIWNLYAFRGCYKLQDSV